MTAHVSARSELLTLCSWRWPEYLTSINGDLIIIISCHDCFQGLLSLTWEV